MLRTTVYDAGALIAAERSQVDFWRSHRAYLLAGGIPLVPAGVIAQVWRNGSRQAQVARLLKGCEIVPLDSNTAHEVGELLGRSGTADPVDGSVALLAARFGAVVATSDPDDIQHLLDQLGDRGKRVSIESF